MKAVKKVLTLLLILTIISQIFIPSNVKAQNTIRTYDSNSLYDEVAKNAVLDNKRSEYVASDTGIDFTKGASEWNGQGVYTIASTKDDLYPIHYYRGNIDNNNVLFGGFCWQIVRTTETGGVKLIYNGKPVDGKCENPQVDDELIRYSWSSSSIAYMYGINANMYHSLLTIYKLYDTFLNVNYEFSFDVEDEDFYYSEEIEYSDGTGYTLKNAKHHNSGENIENLKNKAPLYFCKDGTESCFSINLALWTYIDSYNYTDYLELYEGLTYDELKKKNLLFANDVEYKEGKYQLKNIETIPLLSLFDSENTEKILDGHHYFCDDFSNDCDEVNYIYYNNDNDNTFYYVTFSDGDISENIYNEFVNSTNENDSEFKTTIDQWYSKNILSNTNYLEDTIWCNDRRIVGSPFNKNEKLTNMFESFDNPYGTGYGYDKYYGKVDLSLSCPNKNDRFTVDSKNGNGKLKYPTALITIQEAIYAGSPFDNLYSEKTKLRSSYSFLQDIGYTMTPMSYMTGLYFVKGDQISFDNFLVSCKSLSGSCSDVKNISPMVSLKHSMVVSSGDGSPTNPYEVTEGNTVEYVIDGDMPKGFLPPEVESYLKGSKVKMNGLKAGDIINGYRFLGWHTEDVEVEGDTFDMPENKVVFVGRFEKIVDSPLTYDSIGKYLTTGIIGVVGLFGLVLLKKKY